MPLQGLVLLPQYTVQYCRRLVVIQDQTSCRGRTLATEIHGAVPGTVVPEIELALILHPSSLQLRLYIYRLVPPSTFPLIRTGVHSTVGMVCDFGAREPRR